MDESKYVLKDNYPLRFNNFKDIKIGDGVIDTCTSGMGTGGDASGIYHIVENIDDAFLYVKNDGGYWVFNRNTGCAINPPKAYKISYWNTSDELIKLTSSEADKYSCAFYARYCSNYKDFKLKRSTGFYFVKINRGWEPGYYSSDVDLWNVILDDRNYKTGEIIVGNKVKLPTDYTI